MLAELIPAIAAGQEEDIPYRRRPSLAGPEKCIRYLAYYAMNYTAAPLPGRAALVFDDSSWHEELTLDWIRKTAVEVLDKNSDVVKGWIHQGLVRISTQPETIGQIEIDTDIGRGHLDGLGRWPDAVIRLIEHKAINHFTFEGYWNGSREPLDYFTQCAAYLRRLAVVGINEGILLIKNKNTAQYIEFQLIYNAAEDELTVVRVMRSTGEVRESGEIHEGLIRKAVRRFDEVDAFCKRKQLPDRQYYINNDDDGWRCSYCRYAKECWKGFAEEYRKFKEKRQLNPDAVALVKLYHENIIKSKELEKEAASAFKELQDLMYQKKWKTAFAGKDWQLDLELKESVRMVKEKLSKADNATVANAEKLLADIRDNVQPVHDEKIDEVLMLIKEITDPLDPRQKKKFNAAKKTIASLRIRADYLKLKIRKAETDA